MDTAIGAFGFGAGGLRAGKEVRAGIRQEGSFGAWWRGNEGPPAQVSNWWSTILGKPSTGPDAAVTTTDPVRPPEEVGTLPAGLPVESGRNTRTTPTRPVESEGQRTPGRQRTQEQNRTQRTQTQRTQEQNRTQRTQTQRT